jgi:acetate kinase
LTLVAPDGSAETLDSLEDATPGPAAVAHRVVHGGAAFREPTVIDDEVVQRLEELVELAPLHNAPALEAIAEARRLLPEVPHVAVFDTTFHATIPEVASTYALPRRLRDAWGIRRYGFQGLSVEWAAGAVPVGRLVVCHLGGGCSVTAVRDGRSIDTTMGFTPLEGVPMATRSGSVDPGALLHLLRHGLSIDELEHVLEHESGLLGLSESSGQVEALTGSDDEEARLALEVFSYRIAGAVAAMTTALGGLHALVFTAGIGENSARVRSLVCGRLRSIAVELDEAANEAAQPDADVAAAGASVRIVVLHAREDLVAARAARALLGLTPQKMSPPSLSPGPGVGRNESSSDSSRRVQE